MSLDEDKQDQFLKMTIPYHSLQFMIPRQDTPAFEEAVRASVEAAVRELISSKSLYQNVGFEPTNLERRFPPNQAHSNRADILRREVSQRPLEMIIEDAEQKPNLVPNTDTAINLPIRFIAPACSLWCKVCNQTTTFNALAGKTEKGFAPLHRSIADKTEQTFSVVYCCVLCKKMIFTALIYRLGAKLQLCGFAPRKRVNPELRLPKDLQDIYSDAKNAVAEGDLSAGFYHLRTLLEFYLKQKVGILVAEKTTGDELITEYQKTINEIIFILPPLRPVYENLSRFMHSRTGSEDDFSLQCTIILDHIEGVTQHIRLAERYSSANAVKTVSLSNEAGEAN